MISEMLANQTANYIQLANDSSGYDNETANTTRLSFPTHGKSIRAYYPIIGSAMAASVVCLCLTIVIYAKLNEFKNVHGKVLLSLSICLIANYCLLFMDLIFSKLLPFQLCRGIAIANHAFFVANFFWTNVMAFDIWKTVTSKSPAQGQHVKFWKYSLFAWLGSLVIAMPAIVADLGNFLPKSYAPGFGIERCWFSGSLPILVFFTGPVAFVLIVNLILFVMTARTIKRIENTTTMLQVKVSRQRFHLYLKLFLVMGMIWATEFIPTVTRIYQLFALAGLLTSLQGVLLFIIFVCKRRIWRQIKEKWLDKRPQTASQLGHKHSITLASSRVTLSTSVSNLSQHRV